MPPEIVAQVLGTPIDLPFSQYLEGKVIQQENATGSVAIGSSQSADVNAFRATMDGMRSRVARPRKQFVGFDDLDDGRVQGIRLDIQDVNPRGPNAGDYQITSLDMRMWRVGAQRGSARVPAKMVQFVFGVWKDNLSDALAVTRRRGINIDHQDCIVQRAAGRIEARGACELFRGGLHCQTRGGVKRGVRPKQGHSTVQVIARFPAGQGTADRAGSGWSRNSKTLKNRFA